MTDQPTPKQARAQFAAGLVTPTAGWCPGHTQANLIALPAALADDFQRFADLNPKPCPVLEVLGTGRFAGRLLDGDVRTDLPLYRVFRDGELVEEVRDARPFWREDLVAFLIGCSFTFEHPLQTAGVPVRHLSAGRNVAMYVTDRACVPAGRFSGPLVVSLRGIPADLVEAAARVSGRYPDVHGAPVHVGDPAELGITDLSRPDFGDPPVLEPGDVPVFWACGVTPQAAVMASRPDLAISHAPGHMLITDVRDEEYARN